MTSFEKFQASAEARHSSHGDHVDKLTGYFVAETNRLRGHEAAEPEAPETPPTPASEPPSPPAKRVRWWRRRGRASS